MKATVFIDGGYLRALTRQAGYLYDPNYRGPRVASFPPVANRLAGYVRC